MKLHVSIHSSFSVAAGEDPQITKARMAAPVRIDASECSDEAVAVTEARNLMFNMGWPAACLSYDGGIINFDLQKDLKKATDELYKSSMSVVVARHMDPYAGQVDVNIKGTPFFSKMLKDLVRLVKSEGRPLRYAFGGKAGTARPGEDASTIRHNSQTVYIDSRAGRIKVGAPAAAP